MLEQAARCDCEMCLEIDVWIIKVIESDALKGAFLKRARVQPRGGVNSGP
jgi:hypothetical protein